MLYVRSERRSDVAIEFFAAAQTVFQQGRSERQAEAYCAKYVEGWREARTKLGDCFSSSASGCSNGSCGKAAASEGPRRTSVVS
ncbi:MAG: hypothetical protein LZF62_350068 [Nitrospira sp.]|nr:MAG: hypothetical protein LZF62_350068 [Nitrospira sp.]